MQSNIDSQIFTICPQDQGVRLDVILAKHCTEHSRSYVQYLLEKKAVTVNQKIIKKRYKPKAGDIVSVRYIPLAQIKVAPENIPLDIIFEDESIIVINKSANMCTHPAVGNPCNTVAGALCFHIKELLKFDDTIRPGIVHRLDKDTSGVLIAAKTIDAHRVLSAAFKKRAVKKSYLALCHSCPSASEANFPIFRDQIHRKRMAVDHEKGKESHTTFKVLEKTDLFSLVQANPTTGRTHQIRVHLKALKSPILGDKLYSKKVLVNRQMLHAHTLKLLHPTTNKPLSFEASIPQDFVENYKKFVNSEKKL